MISKKVRETFIAVLGNIFEHYDSALFSLLAPFIAPLFFHDQDSLTALILTYAMLPLGMLTRPIGALFFGYIGDRWGRRKALFYSLLGMAVVTVAIGSLPTSEMIGIYAPILLAIGRMLQSFFMAGGTVGGAIFILEQTTDRKRNFISSLYDASTLLGVLLASAFVMLLGRYELIEEWWRVLFFWGGLTAVLALLFRRKEEEERFDRKEHGMREILSAYKRPLFAIMCVSGFSYVTYSMTFTLMNGFVPLVTSFSAVELMEINTILLIVDMLLLPFFGLLAQRMGKERMMIGSTLLLAAIALPLFAFLQNSTLSIVIAVRFIILILGAAFGATYHAWALERIPERHRYALLSFGYALGSQCIGMPSSAVSLWLYQKLGFAFAPGLYLMMAGLLAAFSVRYFSDKEKIKYIHQN